MSTTDWNDLRSTLHAELRVRFEGDGRVLSLEEWETERDAVTSPAPEEMLHTIDTAIPILQDLYVHMDLKRTRRGIDPVVRLNALREQIAAGRITAPRMFHRSMLEIFKSLGDIHTAYRLPAPQKYAIAFLPFLMKAYDEQQYLVSHTLFDASPKIPFHRGTEVTSWNGMRMAEAVVRASDAEEGSNLPHNLALGLQFMTVRWLGASFDPASPWVVVGYTDENGAFREAKFFWFVLVWDGDPKFLAASQAAASVFEAERCLHIGSDIVHAARLAVFLPDKQKELREQDEQPDLAKALTHLFYGYLDREELKNFKDQHEELRVRQAGGYDEVPSLLPTYLEARVHDGEQLGKDAGADEGGNTPLKGKRFGYIRIRAFPMSGPERNLFKYEFRRLLNVMPGDGLILDIRENPGGSTRNAERVLQFLTANEVTPLPFRFIASPMTKMLAANVYKEYENSIVNSLRTGGRFSAGRPITSVREANDLGQHYFGPVLLITNATTYSAADVFAAGFVDNELGEILGLDETTGAGGSNCWSYEPSIRPLVRNGEVPYEGFTMQVAVRECLRVGKGNAGVPIEEIGIETVPRHKLTKADAVAAEPWGLLFEAAKKLSNKPSYTFKTALKVGAERQVKVDTDVERVDFYINGVPTSTEVSYGQASSPALPDRGRIAVEMHGFATVDGRSKRVVRYIEVFHV